MFHQGGYHELHNESDGVKEKLTEECITWVEAHLYSHISSRLWGYYTAFTAYYFVCAFSLKGEKSPEN